LLINSFRCRNNNHSTLHRGSSSMQLRPLRPPLPRLFPRWLRALATSRWWSVLFRRLRSSSNMRIKHRRVSHVPRRLCLLRVPHMRNGSSLRNNNCNSSNNNNSK